MLTRPPTELAFFRNSHGAAGILDWNCSLNTANAVRMLWGWPSWTFLKVKGQWEVKFSKIRICKFWLQIWILCKKSMNVKCASFFYILIRVQSNSCSKSQNEQFSLFWLFKFNQFDCVLIRISKKEVHFTFICNQNLKILILKIWPPIDCIRHVQFTISVQNPFSPMKISKKD